MDQGFLIEVETLAAALDQLDYFGILKVPQTATPPEIKAAYYRESRAYHPDRFAAYPDAAFRELVGRVYRRVNEAYTVLRDDKKRLRYVQDVNGPERAKKLRFTEVEEAAVKEEQKKKIEEQFGQTPNGRKFFAAALKEMIGRIYRRVNEAYTVLRDDRKRVRYLADVTGPDREKKLRFTEAEESAVQVEQRKKVEEQFGQTPNGRKFYATATLEVQAGRWEAAERALKSALMYEPGNAKFKEQLALVQAELEKTRVKGDYRIK